MATGRSTQLTRQIGEHLVAAELGRLGLIATPFAGNVPMFDLLVADEAGASIAVQVKAIRGASWQFDIRRFLHVDLIDGTQYVRGPVPLPAPDLVCVLVQLHGAGDDAFYILRMGDLQQHFARTYRGGRRPKKPESMHCAVWPKDLEPFRGNWQLVFDTLRGRRPV